MRTLNKLGLAAALFAAAVFGPASASEQDQRDRDRGRQEQSAQPDRPDRGASTMTRGDRHGPPADFRGQRPERAFRDVPQNFRGATTSPRPRMDAGTQTRGTFQGRSYKQFTSSDHSNWRRGHWRHTRHNGKFGWWWYVGGLWFFYNAPVYPFPTFIGYYYDESPYDYYWYWCDDPPGYYPYVRECYYDWVPVPPSY